ncbi:hypothetical protein THTE_2221 [Thermogutta terrifontis]|uniref:Uncharacterized protein n=1 Tax=Thermogutta terrifontis TaxID=1331910 RepID=A0A286RFU1_9BACT|nr:hypothetical protein THTE_2221 [Thermogutta terrifontis]
MGWLLFCHQRALIRILSPLFTVGQDTSASLKVKLTAIAAICNFGELVGGASIGKHSMVNILSILPS